MAVSPPRPNIFNPLNIRVTQLAKQADIGQKRISSFVRYLPSTVRMSVSSRLLPPSILRRTKTILFYPTIGTEFVRYLPLILFCPTSGTEFFRKNPPCHNLSLKFCIPALYIQTNPVDRDLRLSHGISQLRT